MAVHFAQLSDTHVVTDDTDETLYVDNNGRAADAVASIVAEIPAVRAVIATGDLTQWGSDAEFDRLVEVLAPIDVPILPVPGNHDTRAGMRRAFPDHPWAETEDHLSWVVTIDGVRIVGLDTTRPGEPGAEYDMPRDEWLRSVLRNAHDGHTLLAMHHPPFATGIDWMDAAGFVGLDRFVDAIAQHPVDRILCGHMHRLMSSTVAGVPAEVGISTTAHVALDLRPAGPARIIRDPAGYRLLRLDGDSIVGHTRFVSTGEEPFAPDWVDIN